MTTNIITATLTAYCSCSHCTKGIGICADGHKPIEGITIAASRQIPLHSHVVIGTQTFLVQDRLSRKYDNRFDIYFKKHEDAVKFGLWKGQKVTIITKD